jgi:hypothetical protein
MDVSTALTVVSLAVALAVLLVAYWQLGEARKGGRDLKAAAVALGRVAELEAQAGTALTEVLEQEAQFAELQRQTVAELGSLLEEERRGAAEARQRHRLERLLALRDAIETLKVADKAVYLNRDPAADEPLRLVRERTIEQLSTAFVAARENLPCCRSLARIRDGFYPGPGMVNVDDARAEVGMHIAGASKELEQLAATPVP